MSLQPRLNRSQVFLETGNESQSPSLSAAVLTARLYNVLVSYRASSCSLCLRCPTEYLWANAKQKSLKSNPEPPLAPPQKVTQPHKRLSVVQELAFGCLPPLAQTGRSSIFSMAGISRRTPGNVQGKQAEEQQNLPETGVNLVMARLKAFSRSI